MLSLYILFSFYDFINFIISSSDGFLAIRIPSGLNRYLDATFSASIRQTSYPETDVMFDSPKKELNKSFNAAIYKTWYKNSIVGASYGYSQNESNFDNLNYNKHTLGVSYIYNF